MVSNDWNNARFFRTASVPDVERALEAGACLGARDEAGRTALHDAARFSPGPEVLAVLVEHGADLEARDVQGRRALHLAAWREDGEAMAARLLVLGADIDAGDRMERTALHIAAWRG